MSRAEESGCVSDDASHAGRLRELASVFLRLGLIAFGGPAAHVAIMEQEIVQRRKWLSRAEFLDLLGAANLIPGPNSTELAIHIGRSRAGWRGLLVAGCCFILPAFVLVSVIAWGYARYGALPQLQGVLYGIKPVVIAILIQALWRLSRSAIKTRLLGALGAAAMTAGFMGLHELIVLFGSGAVMALIHGLKRGKPGDGLPLLAVSAWPVLPWMTLGAAGAAATPFSLGAMFLFFLKVGSVLFGSGYVLLAFLRADLVERWGWMSEAQLLDAVAVGQVTPGPLFTTATFIGYQLAGFPGAVLATVGIFLPAFVFVAISGPLIPRLRGSALTGEVLDGVNVGALAIMVVVSFNLARASLIDALTIIAAAVSSLLLLRYRLSATWLIAGGAVMGWLAW
ncbi:MAG: chromate efflux transporter [Phycisphaeraceae bacterium]|nr:chromate efflux transporter [Phycisphaeraceae bacterium]